MHLYWCTIPLWMIRTTGRSEGKNLSNIRLEIKYINLGVEHFALSYIWNDKITTNLLKHLREDFFKGIKLHKKQNTENKLHTKKS